jgi:hypothetical protein
MAGNSVMLASPRVDCSKAFDNRPLPSPQLAVAKFPSSEGLAALPSYVKKRVAVAERSAAFATKG